MPSSSTAVMQTANALLRLLIVLNIIAAVAFVAILFGSFLAEDTVIRILERNNHDANVMLTAARLVLVLAFIVVPLAHVLLTRLRAIVRSVEAGDPFVAVNAGRLKVIAWCLLGIQLVDLSFGVVTMTLAKDVEAVSGWTVSITGWVAVLLLFVLARVFEHGARMRDELEGTV